MKMYEYLQIVRQVQSLTDSTDLTVDDGVIRAVFDRRCSPYVSHRSVGFFPSMEPPGSGIVLQNSRFRVVINPGGTAHDEAARSVDGYRAQPIDLVVPSRLLQGIRDEIAAVRGAVPFPPLIGVRIWIPVLTEWDSDCPVFEPMLPPQRLGDEDKYLPIFIPEREAPRPSEDNRDTIRFVPTVRSNGLDELEYEEEE